MDYRLSRLDNGLQVVTTAMPGMYSVTIAVYVGVGSRHELDDEAGSAHLIEHMVFKGTQRRPTAEMISETIERVGGMMNASTDKELTVYWAKVARSRLDIAADLLSDMLLNSIFEEAEVVKERRVVVEELSMSMDSAQDWVHSMIDEMSWPDSALGRDVAGTRESVEGLRREQLLRFMRAHYTPGNAVLSIAGGISHEDALAVATNTFGAWLSADPGAALPVEARFDYPSLSPAIRYETRDIEQVNLCLSMRGISRSSPDRYAFDLLTSILGGAMSSRLFLEVRERRGLAYDIHSYTNKLAETGSLVTYAGVDAEHSRELLEEVLRQLDRLCVEPVPTAELDKAKDFYKGRLLLGLEDTQSVAGWCGAQQQMQGEIREPEEVCADIDAVTPADLQRLANICIRDEYLRVAAIGPASGSEGLEAILHL